MDEGDERGGEGPAGAGGEGGAAPGPGRELDVFCISANDFLKVAKIKDR